MSVEPTETNNSGGSQPVADAPGFGKSWSPTPQVKPTGPANGKATASLALALGALVFNIIFRYIPGASVVVSSISLAILALAIVLGHLARREIRRDNQVGAGRAMAGLVIGYIVFVINIIFWIVVLSILGSHRA
jgi:hypothetical protein